MTTFTQTASAFAQEIKTEAPIIKQKTFNFITFVYQWGHEHPKTATALVAFILGFILGSIF